jgi:predicted AAA+ superfamily ATPase
MLNRALNISNCNHSFFLFGPRQTGKTFLINNFFKFDLYINLLKSSEHRRYSLNPDILAKEISSLKNNSAIIVIDEIQKVPQLLDEVQSVMQNHPAMQFVLTGSSARKLKRAGANLLGGRAVTRYLHPLTHKEMKSDFDLDCVLRFGSLPKIFLEKNEATKARLLKAYVETYLKEEIQQEALTRNIPAFSFFLELAGFENGHIINFSDLSKKIGVHGATVKEYFHILEDTLIGFFLYPYKKSIRKKIVSHPKFYFFDTGIVSCLQKRLSEPFTPATPPYGHAFEHWVILETKRLIDYAEIEASLSFFRTTDDAEVDLVLEIHGKTWAIEIKSAAEPNPSSFKGLKSFISDHKVDRSLCVCQTPRKYQDGPIEFLPWKTFLEEIAALRS